MHVFWDLSEDPLTLGKLPDLSVVFSYKIVVHPSTFKASELLLWVVNSCTVNTEAFFGTPTAAQYSNTW
jgi:hypothetical protein